MSPAFGNASIAADMDWTFHPARNGKSIDGRVFVPFTDTPTHQ
ncbi:MAG TPA: hypothetical protein VFN13_10790 [Rudaea sp.]|nr:hypothetical protein [Rudaea sp.]